MRLDRTPLFDRLADSQRILIAGAGGGFDVFSGLPLYFRLRESGRNVHLANLSFSKLPEEQGRRVAKGMVEIDADAEGHPDYFPEKYLSSWFRARGESVSVWCFAKLAGRPLTEAYRALAERLELDAVVLVDGGTDILMRGDEAGLGTPHEDIASLAAVDELDIPTKLLVCVGLGVDAFHGVCSAHFLEGVAQLIEENGFLGAQSLLTSMPEVRLYREAVDAVIAAMPRLPSIVCTSVAAALDGKYGDYHPTERTAGSRLYINPIMGLMWSFELEAVARRCLYLDDVKATDNRWEIDRIIRDHRQARGKVRPWMDVPL